MKTRTEIELEAAHLEEHGHAVWLERRIVGASRRGVSNEHGLVLRTFPETLTKTSARHVSEATETYLTRRLIAIDTQLTQPEFRLVEEAFVFDDVGRLRRHYGPILLLSSSDAIDVLQDGYRRLDEDRLRERLEPLVERLAEDECGPESTSDAIAEVEALTEELELSPAARMRMRADAVALLDGRLETGDFVSRTVERQECYMPQRAERFAQQLLERIEVA